MSESHSLDTVNNQLENIYISLSNLQGTQVNALTKQSSMMDMVNQENARLASKKDTIDQAALHQSRALYFNDNQRKVSSAYLIIILIIVMTLGALFLVRVIFHHFGGYLPDMLFNILVVMIVSIGIIMSFNQYVKIRKRDPYNFDELKLSSPSTTVPSSTSSSGYNYGSFVGCIGSQCCTPPVDNNPGTIWNPTLGRCVNPQSVNNTTSPIDSSSPPVFTPTDIPSNSSSSPSPSPSIIPSLSPIPSSTPSTTITSLSNPTVNERFTIMSDCASEVNNYGFV